MKIVTLYSFDEAKFKLAEVAAIHYDGKKLTATGDPVVVNYVLREPIVLRGRRFVTAETPLEFLNGLCLHYKSVYLSASAVKEGLKGEHRTALLRGKGA